METKSRLQRINSATGPDERKCAEKRRLRIWGIISAVEAGTGVVIGGDIYRYTFGNRVKLLHLIPEPKPISIGIVALKGKLSSAAEKFWQYAKEAASKN